MLSNIFTTFPFPPLPTFPPSFNPVSFVLSLLCSSVVWIGLKPSENLLDSWTCEKGKVNHCNGFLPPWRANFISSICDGRKDSVMFRQHRRHHARQMFDGFVRQRKDAHLRLLPTFDPVLLLFGFWTSTYQLRGLGSVAFRHYRMHHPTEGP